MAKARAFTLVELLNVVAIVAILGAILMPALAGVRGAAYQYAAVHDLKELGSAASMYAADSNETCMPAFYATPTGMQCWFGSRVGSLPIDPSTGLLRPYLGKKTLSDSSYKAEPYLGDMSGFGYNWAFIGSDFGVTGDFQSYPDCVNAANLTELSDSSRTIVFGTSSYYFSNWLPHGDGKTYDYGFIDPPAYWFGNPDIDFRFQGARVPLADAKMVVSQGNAPVVFADGHAGTIKQPQVLNANFVR